MSLLSNIPYSVKSLSGIITLSDGNGTLIQNGKITTSNINSSNITSDNINTGTIESEGHLITGDLEVSNNIYIDNELHSNDILGRNATTPFNLYTSPANANGLYLGNFDTPLYINSYITFPTGKSDNFITNNLISDLSANPTSLNLWTTNENNPKVVIGNETTDGINLIPSVAMQGELALGENLTVPRILAETIQTNDLYISKPPHYMDVSQLLNTAGDFSNKYMSVFIGTEEYLIPLYYKA